MRNPVVALTFAAVLAFAGSAAAAPEPANAAPSVPLLSAVEKEAVLAVWRQGIRQHDRWADSAQAPEGVSEQLTRERRGTQKALLEAGVLSDGHAWPAGCSAFRQVLAQRLEALETPAGLDEWTDWRNTYLVSCQADAARDTAGWAPLVTARVSGLLAGDTAASGVPAWQVSTALLQGVPATAWTCMAAHMPEAVRQGLDRHEGLRYVARACQVADGVFGSAVACMACGPHPRLSVGRTTKALVFR